MFVKRVDLNSTLDTLNHNRIAANDNDRNVRSTFSIKDGLRPINDAQRTVSDELIKSLLNFSP